MSAAEAKSGRYTYYVCHSLLKQGRGTCATPRLNAKRFEKLIIEQIRDHILTESNMRDLVRMVDEEMDGIAAEQRAKLETIEAELLEVRQRMDRLWRLVETTDLQTEEILPRLRHHQERQEQLEQAADDARVTVTERRRMLDKLETVTAFVKDLAEFLREGEITETKAFIRSFVKQVAVSPNRAVIHYTIPTPWDSPIAGADAAEVALADGVMSTGRVGGLRKTRTQALDNSRAQSPIACRTPRSPGTLTLSHSHRDEAM